VRRTTTPVPLDPEEARQAAYATALRLLAGREMSTARVRDRLRTRGFPDGAVESAITRLTRAGVLDDRRAVQAAARTLVSVRMRGRHRVDRELERLGFDRALIDQALRDVLEAVDESALIARVVESKMRGGKTLGDAAAYRRLFGALLRRGFPGSLIRDALKPYWRRSGPPDV
jgi:regulatory protein